MTCKANPERAVLELTGCKARPFFDTILEDRSWDL